MRRRIFWAIFGVAAGVVVAVLLISLPTLNALRERATRSELERAGAVVGELVEERIGSGDGLGALVGGERMGGFRGELAAVRRAVGGSELGFAAIGPDGRTLGPAMHTLPLDTAPLLRGEAVFASVGDLVVHARPLGRTRAGVTVVALLAREAPVDLQLPGPLLLGSLAAVALLAALVAGRLSDGLSRRLGAMAGAARRLSKGDLSARVAVEGEDEDEVTAVAAAFNEMAERLEESRERERQFLLAVGHDLRTPLTTIAGYAEALQEGLDDPGELRRIAGVLGVESGRLRRLIEDVMLLARLESAEYTLRPEPVEVAAHVSGVVAPFRDRAEAVGVRVEEALAPVGVRVIDPDRVGQVLANLVENALRSTPEGGAVRVRLDAVEGGVRLEVEDTGPGIEPEDLPHVFQRFYVARRYRGVRPEGSGLGLSIVERLAHLMGGTVEAASEVGRGSTFRVTLPAPPPGEPPPTPS